MRKLLWRKGSIVLFLCFTLLISKNVIAWDDKVTHKDLSEYASENSVLSKNNGDYLKNIGFPLALDEVLAWQGKNWTITKWLREGAMLEDSSGPLYIGYIDGKGRSFNHFHNL